jgi:hypothetical protein
MKRVKKRSVIFFQRKKLFYFSLLFVPEGEKKRCFFTKGERNFAFGKKQGNQKQRGCNFFRPSSFVSLRPSSFAGGKREEKGGKRYCQRQYFGFFLPEEENKRKKREERKKLLFFLPPLCFFFVPEGEFASPKGTFSRRETKRRKKLPKGDGKRLFLPVFFFYFLPLVRLPLFRLPLAKTKEEKKSSFPLWGNRKEKNQSIAFGNTVFFFYFLPLEEKNQRKKLWQKQSFFLW